MICMVSGVCFREADTYACYIHWCSVAEVVIDMLRVPCLWLLLGCVRLYSLFLDERGIYHYLLQLTKCKRFVCLF